MTQPTPLPLYNTRRRACRTSPPLHSSSQQTRRSTHTKETPHQDPAPVLHWRPFRQPMRYHLRTSTRTAVTRSHKKVQNLTNCPPHSPNYGSVAPRPHTKRTLPYTRPHGQPRRRRKSHGHENEITRHPLPLAPIKFHTRRRSEHDPPPNDRHTNFGIRRRGALTTPPADRMRPARHTGTLTVDNPNA